MSTMLKLCIWEVSLVSPPHPSGSASTYLPTSPSLLSISQAVRIPIDRINYIRVRYRESVPSVRPSFCPGSVAAAAVSAPSSGDAGWCGSVEYVACAPNSVCGPISTIGNDTCVTAASGSISKADVSYRLGRGGREEMTCNIV